nr:general substrate transporter [Tanacetum cinerariifolium]
MAEHGPQGYTVDEALVAIGYGIFQIKVFSYAMLGSLAEAMELMLLTYIGLAVEADFQLTSSEENLIPIVTYVGIILGTWIWSAVSDSFGRKELWNGLGGGCKLAKASKILEGGAELNKRPLPGGGLIYAQTDESTHNVQPSINTPSAPPMIGEVSRVNESKESTFGTEKAKVKGTSGERAQNEREFVTSEEDEIKDVTLDIDKTAGEIQINEEHHTLKKDDPVDRAGPKVEQGNPENEKEDETNENTKLITRHNNTHKFLDITSMELPGLFLAYWTMETLGRKRSMAIMLSLGYIGFLIQVMDQQTITKTTVFVTHMLMSGSFAVMQIYSEEIYPTQLRTLGVGVAIVVGRVGSIVLPWVGEGMISDDGNKTPAMVMFAFKISVCMVCALLLPIETKGRVLKDDD